MEARGWGEGALRLQLQRERLQWLPLLPLLLLLLLLLLQQPLPPAAQRRGLRWTFLGWAWEGLQVLCLAGWTG